MAHKGITNPKEDAMSEKQQELYGYIHENWNVMQEAMPELAAHYEAYTAETYAGGELDAKTKRLMALCAATVSHCRACMLFQTRRALDLGATRGELLETLAVAANLGGTMGAGEATRVIAYLREEGVL